MKYLEIAATTDGEPKVIARVFENLTYTGDLNLKSTVLRLVKKRGLAQSKRHFDNGYLRARLLDTKDRF